MKPRDRQLAAIRHELTDRVSIDAICVENEGSIASLLGIPAGQIKDRLGIDGRIVAPGYAGPEQLAPDGRPGGVWGSAAGDEYGSSHLYPFSIESPLTLVEGYPWPEPALFDYAGMRQRAAALQANYATRGPYWSPIFCQVCSLMGMEDALVAMIQGLPVFEAILERVAVINHDYTKSMLDACGDTLDIYCLGDDFATQRGMLFSPQLWRRHLKPIYAAQFAMAKAAGKPVWFHSCGDVTAVLPDLIDIGVDVWETVQLHTLPMPPEQLKRRFGKNLAFFGAVNTQKLPFTSLNELKEEVERCIRVLGKDGGYICGPDHHIKYDISPEKTLMLFDTAQQYRYRRCTL